MGTHLIESAFLFAGNRMLVREAPKRVSAAKQASRRNNGASSRFLTIQATFFCGAVLTTKTGPPVLPLPLDFTPACFRGFSKFETGLDGVEPPSGSRRLQGPL
jgi:hypothetical protein